MDYGDLSKFIDGVYDFFTKNALLHSGQIIDLISAKILFILLLPKATLV